MLRIRRRPMTMGLMICLAISCAVRDSDKRSHSYAVYVSHVLPSSRCQQLLDKSPHHLERTWAFNSGNPIKTAEFKHLFDHTGLTVNEITNVDVHEIDAEDVLVSIHKASQIKKDGLIVEDSVLDIENSKIGVNLKWHVDRLETYIGRRATLHSLLAYKMDEVVFVFKDSIEGSIVSPRGPQLKGARLNAFFQPKDSKYTLAENKQLRRNPRARALDNMIGGRFLLCSKPLKSWVGPWQPE